MTGLEKVLASVDRPPVDGLLRAVIGFVSIPILSLLHLDVHSTWTVVFGLLSILLAFRVVPAVLRRLIRVSPEVNAVWAERRQLAKRYDCFQWQKIFYIGIGMAAYMYLNKDFLPSTIEISSFCCLFGGIGLVRWYARISNVRTTLVNRYVL